MNIRKFLFVFSLVVLPTSCAETGTGPIDLPDLTHDPVLFVHGYGGNRSQFNAMIASFKADGWTDAELYANDYSFVSSNAVSAQEIRDQVNAIVAATGATKVDIVAFSMGSISSRYYMKNLGGDARVDAWVSLGGPNHGTDAALNCSDLLTPCREILPGSAFLAELNSGDETPGLPRYATWRSPCDATINPDESVVLAGATNSQTGCIGHLQLVTDQATYTQVRNFID
ncbi:MAG TPA: triacylglycerol lipase [Gemmatimonadaceae bacterium]|nr:triacylglycerol lipase [Gemmatimonadaceae bacterium]